MRSLKNLVEFYDELYPITESQRKFYAEMLKTYSMPAKVLRIGCGTGLFESNLAKEGYDVTGIDNAEELLASANLRKRNQLMAIRFFQMNAAEMDRFLAKNFYNVISILNDRICFYSTKKELQEFFVLCKNLIAPGGQFVIQLTNFEGLPEKGLIQLPVRESVRTKLFTELSDSPSGARHISLTIENGSGKLIPVIKDIPFYPLLPSEIEAFAEDAGFSIAEFYADFDKNQFTGNEDSYIVIIK